MDTSRFAAQTLVLLVTLVLGPIGVQAREVEAPVSIRIETPDGLAPGVERPLKGSVELHADAPRLVLRFESEGPLSLDAPPIVLGPLFDGEVVPFEGSMSCTGYGDAVVHVWAEVTDELGAPRFSNRGSLYARLRSDGNLFGRGGFMALEQRAIEARRAAGKISDDQADRALRELVRLSPTLRETPPAVRTFTPGERRRNRLAGLPETGAAVSGPQAGRSPAEDKVTVQGTLRWQDWTGNWQPLWAAWIEVAGGSFTLTFTDAAGNYHAEVDPGDVQIIYRLRNRWLRMRGLTGSGYSASSPIYENVPAGGVLDLSFDFDRDAPVNDANSVFQAATWIAAYGHDLTGRLGRVGLQWPNGEDFSYYRFDQIYIEEPDRYDWDVVHHEYGHFVMDEHRLAEHPGGRHRAGDCLAFDRQSKDKGVRLAWAEGWPSYFAISGQIEMGMADLGMPRVGDTWYQDVEDGSVVFDLESEQPPERVGLGEDNELSVQRLLFDLFDTNEDGADTISRSARSIWSGIRERFNRPRLSQFWNRLRFGQTTRTELQMGAIAAEHGIGPAPETPLDGALVTPGRKTFSWRPNVGCPDSYEGESFDLLFYDAETFDPVLTIPDLTASSYTLDPSELLALTSVTHDVLWAVEGRHDAFPPTGPYLGAAFAATVNHPPVAAAGEDVSVECGSATATPVTLDGSASGDPDGDALGYTWTAPEVAFDDPTAAVPTGRFPFGATTVELEVSDSIQQDRDTTVVTVVDTTLPEIQVKLIPAVLWPPNHKLRTVRAEITVADGCDAEPEVTLVSVTSNEGSARVDDIRDAERGSDDRELRLRAARDGKGDGRVYTIVYRVTDRAGNSADAVTEVRVPHDRGR